MSVPMVFIGTLLETPSFVGHRTRARALEETLFRNSSSIYVAKGEARELSLVVSVSKTSSRLEIEQIS